MDLRTIGRLIAERRGAKGLTLQQLATAAGVGRSTLAAFEGGKIRELGFGKVERLCAALDLVLEVRPPALDAPLMAHRHITEAAGRDLTKAAIEDIITRGDFPAWRGLVQVMRADRSGQIVRRAREVSAALRKQDARAHAFALLMPDLLRAEDSRRAARG